MKQRYKNSEPWILISRLVFLDGFHGLTIKARQILSRGFLQEISFATTFLLRHFSLACSVSAKFQFKAKSTRILIQNTFIRPTVTRKQFIIYETPEIVRNAPVKVASKSYSRSLFFGLIFFLLNLIKVFTLKKTRICYTIKNKKIIKNIKLAANI